MRARVDEMLQRHWNETGQGIRDCNVNELLRGQCTTRDHFVFKIDIVNSTQLLRSRPGVYVQLVHPFFSTVDAICRDFGADPNQTEYHGDSVLALFPVRGNFAVDVARAAFWSNYAFRQLAHAQPLRQLNLRARSVLHFGPLNVAVTGPYGETHRVAVGIPIHVAAKREKDVDPNTIWASDAFVNQLTRAEREAFFTRNTVTKTRREQVLVTPPAPPATALADLYRSSPHSALSLANLLRMSPSTPIPQPKTVGGVLGGLGALNPPHNALAAALRIPMPPPPRYEWQDVPYQEDDGWKMSIWRLFRDQNLPLTLLQNPTPTA